VEGATGVGALLAQQLVAAGECVVDVPPSLSARVRLLDAGRKDKTDEHDARSAAVVALRHRDLSVVAVEDHRHACSLAVIISSSPPAPVRSAACTRC
jgi:hypothetical protein